MESDGRQASVPVAPVQLTGEQDLRELGVGIRPVHAVFFLALQIVDVNVSEAIGITGGEHDCSPRLDQAIQQPSREQKTGKVVHLKRDLVAVLGDAAIAAENAAGVVGKNINTGILLQQFVRECADLSQLREVYEVVIGSKGLRNRRGFSRRAAHDDDVVSVGGEPLRGGSTDAVACSSDDDDFVCRCDLL